VASMLKKERRRERAVSLYAYYGTARNFAYGGAGPYSLVLTYSLPFRLHVRVWSFQVPPAFLHSG
jgi:hypothetical protein